MNSDVTANSTITDVEEIPGIKGLWAETLGDSQICIAVLDGSVDRAHPCLAAANLTQLETLVPDVSSYGAASEHGTHVASIIFGQHDGSIKGIAPRCRGLSVPIFSDGPDGSIASCSQLDLARAITQAVEAGAHIINISGGELSPSGSAHPLLADAVRKCTSRNVLIVAATGNEGCDCLHVPGALPSVLAIGAMDAQGLPLAFGNWGAIYRTQGILAPGENILGAKPGGKAIIQSGTSYATPVVSAIAGLLLSLQVKLGQQPDPHAVRRAILESTYVCDPQAISDCRPFLTGSLNIAGAHSLIVKEKNIAMVKQPEEVTEVQTEKQKKLTGIFGQLKVGDAAPDFRVKDHKGHESRLSDYRGRTVVLWFYPQADTPG